MPPIRSNTFVNTINTDNENIDPTRTFLIVFALVSLFVGIVFFCAGLFFDYKTKTSLQEIANIDAALNALPLQEMSNLSIKINTVDATQKDRNSMTMLLSVLSDSIEKYTYFTDLSFSDRSAKASAFASIKGIAESYEDIVKQIDRLKLEKYKPLIKNVSLGEISSSEENGNESIKFTLEVELDSKIRNLSFDIAEKDYDPSKKPIKIINISAPTTTQTIPVNNITATNTSASSSVINKQP